jgi:tetratricopeptide (TPR) repeat protein
MLPRGRALIRSWTLAALCGVISTAGILATSQFGKAHPKPVPTRAPARPAKIAVFGVDAGDWRVIDPLAASGRLPAFARLKQVGSVGVLRAEPPLLSPLIWTTIATGRPPEEHGVLDFMVDLPGGGQTPVNGGARRAKALWEIWSEAGRRVLVAGWWATWPADAVRGLIASDRIATPHIAGEVRPDAGLVYPPSALPEVQRRIVEPGSIDYDALCRVLPVSREEFDRASAASRESAGRLYGDKVAHFRAALAAARSYRRISTELARQVQPDFWAAYYEIVDTASHLFAAYRARGSRAVAAAYVEVDAALAETARALDPDALVIVVSDHGFQPGDAGIREDPADLTAGATAWHRPYGIVAAATAGALAGTAPSAPAAPLGIVSPLDIAPTLLARAGLAVAADMPGRVIPALAFPPASGPAEAGPHARRIPTYGAHVLPDTPASGRGPAAAELERLRALGYVSGAAAATSLSRVNLGEILFRKGDLRGAARELEAVLRADPLNGRAALWLARAYVGLGRRDEAVGLYDRLVQASLTSSFALDPIVVLAATDLDLGAGRVGAARARLSRLPAAATRTPEVLVATAATTQAQGDLPAAERTYRAALQAAPSDFEALQRLMDLLLSEKRAPEAAVLAAGSARSFPASPQHLSLAGEAALAAKRYPEAETFFARARSLAPVSVAVQLDLARAQLLGGRPDACLDTLRDAASSREAEMLRGAAHSRKREPAAAVGAFERALTLGVPTPDLLNALAAAQIEAGRTPDALRSLERSLALDPNQAAARALLERARKQ